MTPPTPPHTHIHTLPLSSISISPTSTTHTHTHRRRKEEVEPLSWQNCGTRRSEIKSKMLASANRGGLATSGDGVGWILEVETRGVFRLVARGEDGLRTGFLREECFGRAAFIYFFSEWSVVWVRGFAWVYVRADACTKTLIKNEVAGGRRWLSAAIQWWFSVSPNKLLSKLFSRGGPLCRWLLMHGSHGAGWHGSDCHYCRDRTVCCRAQAVWDMGAAVAGR